MDQILSHPIFVENLAVAIRQSIRIAERVDKMKRREPFRLRNRIRFENNHDSGGVELIRMAEISGDKVRSVDDDGDGGDDDDDDGLGRFGSGTLQPVINDQCSGPVRKILSSS